MRTLGRAVAAATAAMLLLAGCAPAEPLTNPAVVTPVPEPTASVSVTTLQTLIDAPPESPTLEQLSPPDQDGAEVVSYSSGGLTIHGVIRRPAVEDRGDDEPATDERAPGVVFVHGAVDAASYSGLVDYSREQRLLQDMGYVVFTPDLRNHGDSDDDPSFANDLQVGSTLDAVNAARALATDPGVDPDRIAVVGHSLGGAIALGVAVVAPEVARATVALAPSNSSPWVIAEHFLEGTPYFDWLVLVHGTYDENPEYWDAVSSLTFVDRAASPLLIVHGTADEVVPPEWSRELAAAWTAAGKDVRLIEIEGADHMFAPHRDEVFAEVEAFLAANLR